MAGEEKKSEQPWGGLKGTVVKGSLKELEKGVEGAVAYTKDGVEKTMKVVAYSQNKNAVDALKAAEASGAEMTFRGPWFGRGESMHLAVKQVMDPTAPKAEKAEKPQLSDEEKAAAKAARAESGRAAALERDAARTPVLAGSVAEGGSVEVKGVEVAVTKVGRAFTLDDDAVKDLAERFEGASFKAGDEVAYASFDAEELKKKLEAAEPSPEP